MLTEHQVHCLVIGFCDECCKPYEDCVCVICMCGQTATTQCTCSDSDKEYDARYGSGAYEAQDTWPTDHRVTGEEWPTSEPPEVVTADDFRRQRYNFQIAAQRRINKRRNRRIARTKANGSPLLPEDAWYDSIPF